MVFFTTRSNDFTTCKPISTQARIRTSRKTCLFRLFRQMRSCSMYNTTAPTFAKIYRKNHTLRYMAILNSLILVSRKRFEPISLKSIFFASSVKYPLAVCRYGYGCLPQNLLKNISFKVLAVLPNVKLHLDKEFDCSHTDVLQRRILQYQSIFRR